MHCNGLLLREKEAACATHPRRQHSAAAGHATITVTVTTSTISAGLGHGTGHSNTIHAICRILTEAQRLWRKVPNEYDDYIANPKQSGYRSLHTCVKGGGQTVPLPMGAEMLPPCLPI